MGMTRRASAPQRRIEIPIKVLHVLDAGGEAQEVRRARSAWTLDGGPVLDQALDAAEGGRPLPQADPRGRADRRGLAVRDLDREHVAEAVLHLPGGDVMAR